MWNELECPKCHNDVKMKWFETTECPECGHGGYWDTQEIADGTDEWVMFLFDTVEDDG